MKKFFSAVLIIVNINCFAQAKKWFVSFSIAPAFGGASASLKNQMKTQGFGDDAESTFHLFGSGRTSYPRGGSVAFLARGGKKITDRKSIYFVAGISQKATVEGFHKQGWSDGLFGLFAGTYGKYVAADYTTYQLTTGYMYSFQNSRTRLGFGPSLFLLNYSITENYSNKQSHSSLTPGATCTARIPLGKEKKLFGLELVFEGNAAVPVKMKGAFEQSDFRPGRANMFSVNMGLAFSFRR